MKITPELMQAARYASPLSTAVSLSQHDPTPFVPARHLKYISDAITDAVYSGEGRLIITTPPRHGKSWLVSKWTPLWFLAKFPEKWVMNCGYGTKFAKKWGREVRNLTQQHADTLPFKLSTDSKAVDKWSTTDGGGMLAAGIGGPITGEGADLLIVDDPIKNWREASSYNYREATWEWWTSTARTRLHPKGTIIIVLTRWNEDDLAGRLIKQGIEDFKLINMPAICYEPGDVLGRAIGEPLWPERYGLKEFDILRQQDALVWESLFQQRPGATAGLGNVYHAFDEATHVRSHIDRDHQQRMFLSMDFNVDPMCGVLGQYREYYGGLSHLTGEKMSMIDVLDEICLPESNTREWCEEAYRRIREINGNFECVLEVYGDPAGNARHTSQVGGSDWDIVRNFFGEKRGIDLHMYVKRKAPSIKDRINAVNMKLKNANNQVGTTISKKCKMLIRDLKNVKWKRDASGNTSGQLDKAQADLTHVSDAYGYFVETKFGRSQNAGDQAGILQ